MDNTESPEVLHNAKARRFEFHLGESMARLDYHVEDHTMIIAHTGVPAELANRGVGAKLVKSALEYARESGLMVVPHCSFAAAYIRRNPQYQSLLEPTGGAR